MAQEQLLSGPPAPVSVGAAQFMQMPLPERRLLLTPWLPAQGLAMVYAPRGVGKTYFALSVAWAVASGGKFLAWHAPNPARVLYLDGEMPANMMQQRLKELVTEPDAAWLDNLSIVTPDLQGEYPMPDLSSPRGQAQVDELLAGVELVVVDNISTLCIGGVENEAESWTAVQQWALRLRARGTSVLFVHHSGKSGKQRGTSKREDVLDTVISLRRPADYRPEQGAAFETHFEKNRGFTGATAIPLDVRFDTEAGQGWIWKPLEGRKTDKIISLLKAGMSQAEIARKLGVNPSTVSRAHKGARASGLIE